VDTYFLYAPLNPVSEVPFIMVRMIPFDCICATIRYHFQHLSCWRIIQVRLLLDAWHHGYIFIPVNHN